MDASNIVPASLLTVREAAAWLTVSTRTLFSLTAGGELPAVRLGRSVRYRLEDLESFVPRLSPGGARRPQGAAGLQHGVRSVRGDGSRGTARRTVFPLRFAGPSRYLFTQRVKTVRQPVRLHVYQVVPGVLHAGGFQ